MAFVFQVIVVGVQGEKFTVGLCNSEEQMKAMTVLQLKKKIGEKLPGNAGANMNNIRLVFTDQQLTDDSTLSSYGIQNRSIIQLVLRVPGGDLL